MTTGSASRIGSGGRQSSTVTRWMVAALLGVLAATVAESATRVVILGATSKTANQLIPQSLAAGYEVVAVARRPEAVTTRHERLTVMKGDVYDEPSIESALRGGETVYMLVSPRVEQGKKLDSMDLFSKGVTNVIAAMKKKGGKRIVVASSIAVETEIPEARPPEDNPRAMWLWNVRALYLDMAAMERIVAASGLEFVIDRPGFLLDEAAHADLKLSIHAPSPPGRIVSTPDFAALLVRQAVSDEHLGKTVGIYSDRDLRFGQNANYEELAKKAAAARKAAGGTE
jgi:uncharacterized protein YbjT (DUF2867 family)